MSTRITCQLKVIIILIFELYSASASVDSHVPQGTLCAFGFCAIRVFRVENEFHTYLSVKQTVTKVFAELVTPVPPKTIVFRIKLLTFANRKEKASPTAPPDLPERGGVQIARLPQKVSEVSARMLRDKRS